MGSRLLKRWITLPLKGIASINERLDIVEYYLKDPDFREEMENYLAQVGDLERVISKVAAGRISPREVVQLKIALQALKLVKERCSACGEAALQKIAEQINPCESVRERIEKEILPEPSSLISKGNVIAPGVSAELDELRTIMNSGKDFLVQIQQRESEKTGIPSLKVAYNNVFGYYIEVRNTHKDKVPPEWIRKQTLVSAERYITEEHGFHCCHPARRSYDSPPGLSFVLCQMRTGV